MPVTVVPLHTLAGNPAMATEVLGVVIAWVMVFVHPPMVTVKVILPFPVAKLGLADVDAKVVPPPAAHEKDVMVNPAKTCVVLKRLSPLQSCLILKLGTNVTVSSRQRVMLQ